MSTLEKRVSLIEEYLCLGAAIDELQRTFKSDPQNLDLVAKTVAHRRRAADIITAMAEDAGVNLAIDDPE